MKIVEKQITDIHPYEKNSRINDQAVDAVARSIELYGWRSPIIVDKDNVIICGHTRLKAAQQLGIKKVPCIVAENLTPPQIKAYRIADNRLAEIATWDYKKVLEELDFLRDAEIDMSLLDFEIIDLAEPIEDEPHEGKTLADNVPAAPKKTETQKGSMYQLGKHILYCSDQITENSITFLLGGKTPRLIYGNFQKKPLETISQWLNSISFLTDCSCYFFTSPEQEEHLLRLLFAKDISVNFLYWIKKSSIASTMDYKQLAETCLFGYTDKSLWHAGEDKSNLFVHEIKAKRSAAKPSSLLVEFLKNSTSSKDIVFSFLDEDGSMLLACEQMGRQCFLFESDPKKCDIIRKRFAEFIDGDGCDWASVTPRRDDE